MKKCHLCKIRDADKKNSHIFPRFMGVSLLKTIDGKRAGYAVGKSKSFIKPKVFQDTPKEDNILCSSCESRIGELERIFANGLINKIKDPAHSNEFSHVKLSGYNKTFIPTIDPILFKKTILTFMLRAQISSLEFFSNLRLKDTQFEKVRQILNNEIAYEDIPMVILTSGDIQYGKNYYYAHSIADQNVHLLWVNDYLFIILFDESSPKVKSFINLILHDETIPFVGIIPPSKWDKIRTSLLKASSVAE